MHSHPHSRTSGSSKAGDVVVVFRDALSFIPVLHNVLNLKTGSGLMIPRTSSVILKVSSVDWEWV